METFCQLCKTRSCPANILKVYVTSRENTEGWIKLQKNPLPPQDVAGLAVSKLDRNFYLSFQYILTRVDGMGKLSADILPAHVNWRLHPIFQQPTLTGDSRENPLPQPARGEVDPSHLSTFFLIII